MIDKDTILNADILKVLPQIPDGTFDCVLSDHPYQIETHGRGIGAKRPMFQEMAEWTSLDNDWYNESILNEYVRICKFPNIFLFGGKRDVYKMLKFAEEHGYQITRGYQMNTLCILLTASWYIPENTN